jgi:hypothetical protein
MEPTEEDQFVTGRVSTQVVALADPRICVACLPCVLLIIPRTKKIGSCAMRGVDEPGGELGYMLVRGVNDVLLSGTCRWD